LTGKADLTAVLREGKRTRTKYLDVRAIASPLAHPRVGIVVPKQGRTTTDRNRLKRRLRELVRIHVLPSLAPIDLVIVTRSQTYTASFAQLHAEVLSAVEKVAGALRTKE
jgi:ribonuclease P protein component